MKGYKSIKPLKNMLTGYKKIPKSIGTPLRQAVCVSAS